MENRVNQRTPLDDDFDPKHFVKKVETELVFDSDGELDTLREGNKNNELSSIMKQEESGNQEEQTDPIGNTLFEGSFQQNDQFFQKENRINFQYQDLSLKKRDQTVAERKFSGIYEDEYFMFVEDYDKFIGEFVSDEKVKIVRGFLNNNEFDRIYYTRIVPNEKTFANLLMVHGFGHSAKYLEVRASDRSSGTAWRARASRCTCSTSGASASRGASGTTRCWSRSTAT
jgi:hypothetical protein